MIIGVLKENADTRVALVPQVIKRFIQLDAVEVWVEEGASTHFSMQEYAEAGAKVVKSRDEILAHSDVMLQVELLAQKDVEKLKSGTLCISHMNPYANKEFIDLLNKKNINSISMEMIPRSTLAQKMDALSSQASLAGYVAIIKGANALDKIFPMMMTPSGTIPPAKVFVIGAGVAGLQAIACAKRLGAKVEAFDTRPVVEEQVLSLGAKFVKVDLGEMSQTKDGYAKALSDEQLVKQREAMKKSCANADLVVTTAKLFGRKAPQIITKDILEAMKPGSVIVDLAAGSGGNVVGSVVNESVNINGITIIGIDHLESEVAIDASTMYANNLYNLFTHFYDKENKQFNYALEDEILASSLITYEGTLVNARLVEFWG